MRTTNILTRYRRAVTASGPNSEFGDRAKHFAAPSLAKYFSHGTDAEFLLKLTTAAQSRADAMTGVFNPPSKDESQAVFLACRNENSAVKRGGWIAVALFCLFCGLLFGPFGFFVSLLGPSVFAFLIGRGFAGMFSRSAEPYQRAISIAARTLALERQKEEYWKALTWRELEIKVASIFTRQGYRAKATPSSGDKGIDVIAISGKEKIVIQCKQYNKPAQPSVVRELLGAKVSEGADRTILICTGGFTQGAVSAAQENGIELWDLQNLIAEAQKSNPQQLTPSCQETKKRTPEQNPEQLMEPMKVMQKVVWHSFPSHTPLAPIKPESKNDEPATPEQDHTHSSYNASLPTKKLGKLIDAVQGLIAEGVNTPEQFAATLKKIDPDKLPKYSEALWNMMKACDTSLEEKPDWKSIYFELAATQELSKRTKISAFVSKLASSLIASTQSPESGEEDLELIQSLQGQIEERLEMNGTPMEEKFPTLPVEDPDEDLICRSQLAAWLLEAMEISNLDSKIVEDLMDNPDLCMEEKMESLLESILERAEPSGMQRSADKYISESETGVIIGGEGNLEPSSEMETIRKRRFYATKLTILLMSWTQSDPEERAQWVIQPISEITDLLADQGMNPTIFPHIPIKGDLPKDLAPTLTKWILEVWESLKIDPEEILNDPDSEDGEKAIEALAQMKMEAKGPPDPDG